MASKNRKAQTYILIYLFVKCKTVKDKLQYHGFRKPAEICQLLLTFATVKYEEFKF